MVGPYLCLCTNEKAFRRALKALDVKEQVSFLGASHADATAHTFNHPSGELACIVCIGDVSGRTGIQIASLLVHEAVHVWQQHASHIGEGSPGLESEAYAIQSIAQRLMESYVAQAIV